ncbi:TPA: hypothetical protein HA265_05325 [Candidatus Woesearchaeota archaeon]|nr:hypothetical protein [Candidatus Woesearchaeota archaeon]
MGEKGDKRERSLSDYFSTTGFTALMYLVIFLVVIAVMYFIIMNYFMYRGLLSNKVSVDIKANEVQLFKDGYYPVVNVKVTTRLESKVMLEFRSEEYSVNFTNEDYVKEFSRLAVLPKEMQDREFRLTVFAEDRLGAARQKTIEFRTKKMKVEKGQGGVRFSVS